MKIALIGSAPSSLHLGPFTNPDWKIWGCSPGAALSIRPETGAHRCKIDSWFELHRYEPHQSWFHPGYQRFLSELECPLFMIEHIAQFPNSFPYPYEQIKSIYHPLAPFTSTFAWMFALAIQQPGIEEIGLWGVDMAATEEYSLQLPGAHHWIMECDKRGIKVTTPMESDLLNPLPEYGFQEVSHKYAKFQARAYELAGRQRDCETNIENRAAELRFLAGAVKEREIIRAQGIELPKERDEELSALQKQHHSLWENHNFEKHFLQGAIDDLQYMKQRWPGKYEPRRNPEPPQIAAPGGIQETQDRHHAGNGKTQMDTEPGGANGGVPDAGEHPPLRGAGRRGKVGPRAGAGVHRAPEEPNPPPEVH